MNLVHAICRLGSALILLSALYSCSENVPSPSAVWTEGTPDDTGKVTHTIELRGVPASDDWCVYFSQIPERLTTPEGEDARITNVNASLYRIDPKEGLATDTLVFHYKAWPLKRHSWAPEGFILKHGDGKEENIEVEYRFLPLENDGQQWYKYNAKFETQKPSASDIIPTLKNKICPAPRPEGWYKLSIGEDIIIESEDADGAYYAQVTLEQLKQNYGDKLPQMTVEDWPDFQYRGFMLDVSRNFTSKDNLFRLIDMLARYKVNYLHMHLADDEGWRLEVPEIPELTGIGSVHSLDPSQGLIPSYDGNADPHDRKALSNGHYSQSDFVEILRYAWERRIRVIPEFDMPGHSRALIYSMHEYEKRSGDTSMRLSDPADSSRYESAQGYWDNVLDVTSPGLYKFLDKLFGYVAGLYEDAGAPLHAIHVGGDEVPRSAWHGRRELYSEFMRKAAEIAASHGIKISAWQEVSNAKGQTAAYLKEQLFSVNVWDTAWGQTELPYKLAAKGYPVVLSNAEYAYADQVYSSNKQEVGHSWARAIDDTRSFNIPLRVKENVLGVQGQLFTETIRSFDDVCYHIFPKMLGLFERGWNAGRLCSEDEFYGRIVYHEMPLWEARGLNYHIPQPGLLIDGDNVLTNSRIPDAEIEVTMDGETYRATAVYGSRRSVPTTQRIEE